MPYFKLELLTLADSTLNVLDSAADSNRAYFLADTISEFYSQQEVAKSTTNYSAADPQLNTYCYSYDESISLHTNAQKELSFKLNDHILYQDQIIRNPFTISITVGSLLLLTDKNGQQYLFTVKSINVSFENNNLVYEYSCQDSFSYQLSRQNSGYTINNDSTAEDFIGSKSVDWWVQKICNECNVHYVYLPLQLGLYQAIGDEYQLRTYSAPVQDLKSIIKPYYNKRDYPDFFTQFPFSVSDSTANAAIIAAAETVGLQIQTYEHTYYDADHHLRILRYFWLKPLKDHISGITGYKYSPNNDVQEFSLSFSGDNLSSILNVQSQTRSNNELVNLLPNLTPFFANLFGTAYWRLSSVFYPGRFNNLCHGQYLTANYSNLKNDKSTIAQGGELIADAGATDALGKCRLITSDDNNDPTIIVFTGDYSTFRDLWQLYDRVDFNHAGIYCTLTTTTQQYKSNWDRWYWVLLQKKVNKYEIVQKLTEYDDIPWFWLDNTAAADSANGYYLGLIVADWRNDPSILTMGELQSRRFNIYRSREATTADLEFARIADKCPWLENKLRSFDYFQKIGLISKAQLNSINNVIENDLRKINGESLLYTNDYYQALHKRTTKLADLLSQFDSLGAAAESDVITPYSTDGKVTFPLNYFTAAYQTLFPATYNNTTKTQLTAYDDLITSYTNLYFNANQRFLKNLYQFREYFNALNTRYCGADESFGVIDVQLSADEPAIADGAADSVIHWICFKTGTTFSRATAKNVSLDQNETPQQVLYSTINKVSSSATDSAANHTALTVVDKLNVSDFYQLSDIQSGERQITEEDATIYSKDNLYWAFIEYDPKNINDLEDDTIKLNAKGGIDLLKSKAAQANKNVRRTELPLRPLMDKQYKTVSLGDLWNIRHLDEIYQRDTLDVYSPITAVTDHTPLSNGVEGACWGWWDSDGNYYYKYFSFKLFQNYTNLDGIDDVDKKMGRTDDTKNNPTSASYPDVVNAYFNNFPIENLYYLAEDDQEGSSANRNNEKYKEIAWLNSDSYASYYKYILNTTAVLWESIVGGIVGIVGRNIAGYILRLISILANPLYLDTSGSCGYDLDQRKVAGGEKYTDVYYPTFFQNSFPCITDKSRLGALINNKSDGDTYTYEDQLQYLPRNFVNYRKITDNNEKTGLITTISKKQKTSLYYKDSWAKRLTADSRVNNKDTYYLLPICAQTTQNPYQDAKNWDNKQLPQSSVLLKHDNVTWSNLTDNPFFQHDLVSTVLDYPVFGQAVEVHFSQSGKLIDVLKNDKTLGFNSFPNRLKYNDEVHAFFGVQVLTGTIANGSDSGSSSTTMGITIDKESGAISQTTAGGDRVSQVFMVYHKQDYTPITHETVAKNYWDTFKNGYNFYNKSDDSQVDYTKTSDLLIGCYSQASGPDDTSVAAVWDEKGATAYWEKNVDSDGKTSYTPVYTARQLLQYDGALAAPIRARIKTGTTYDQTLLFNSEATLNVPIAYGSIQRATDGTGATAQTLLPQQDTLDLTVSYKDGHYYLSESGKPQNSSADTLVVTRTINNQTYSTTFKYNIALNQQVNDEKISQRTNGAFWLRYHVLPTSDESLSAALQPLFDYAAAIETQLESYWTVAYAASKYCDYFLPEHWQPYTDKETNYFSDQIIVKNDQNHAYISDTYVPNISVSTTAEQKSYSLTYYSNPKDRDAASGTELYESSGRWIIDNAITVADTTKVINNNEAYRDLKDFVNTVAKSTDAAEYFNNHFTLTVTSTIDSQKKYYYVTSGGCRWNQLINFLSGRKDLHYDHYSGIYARLLDVLLTQYQNNPFYTYTQLKKQHDLIWKRLYQSYPNLRLENTYSNSDATTSWDLYQFATWYFKKYCQPERNYNISTIDIAQLRGYTGDATKLHIGDAIELDPNEWVDDKTADDPVYNALNQYLFISDISYNLRSDADINLTVNDVKYEDKLIKSLARLVR